MTESVVSAVPSGAAAGRVRARPPTDGARSIAEIPEDRDPRPGTGLSELDRVLGGGLVHGSVTLVGGEPGAGKSTLLLQTANALAKTGRSVLYVSAEESAGQVRLRATRLGALAPRLLLAVQADVRAVLGLVEQHAPDVLVVDSIQTVRDPETTGTPGGVSQVRACAEALTESAKRRRMATIMVGHVTKDGSLAGPRALEHLVDTVVEFDADRHHALRLVRAVKNRYGPVGEVGCFEMTQGGLQPVADAGRLFVGDAAPGTTGVAVTLTSEGLRPLACEVQALVVDSRLSNPRRVGSGVDSQRLSLLLAVLERRAGISLAGHDVYASSVGGLRLVEPGVDVALALAMASSCRDVPVRQGLVAIGEVGLAGELRAVARTEPRLAEAARLGFGSAVVPAAYDGDVHGLRIHRVPDLRTAVTVALDTR